MACGPPVEAPIATISGGLTSLSLWERLDPGVTPGGAGGSRRRRTSRTAAMLFTTRINSSPAVPSLIVSDRLSWTARAPASSAASARSRPRAPPAEVTRTIGVGRSRMISRAASRPFITGIFSSRVITSGRNCSTALTASTPLVAKPTISMCGSRARTPVRIWRWTAESSTTSTRSRRDWVIAAARPSAASRSDRIGPSRCRRRRRPPHHAPRALANPTRSPGPPAGASVAHPGAPRS